MVLLLSVPRVGHFWRGIASAWYETAAKVNFAPYAGGVLHEMSRRGCQALFLCGPSIFCTWSFWTFNCLCMVLRSYVVLILSNFGEESLVRGAKLPRKIISRRMPQGFRHVNFRIVGTNKPVRIQTWLEPFYRSKSSNPFKVFPPRAAGVLHEMSRRGCHALLFHGPSIVITTSRPLLATNR